MAHRGIALLLSAIALAIGVGVVASSASAQETDGAPVLGTANLGTDAALMLDSGCPSGYACFWTGDSFGGSKILRGAEWAGTGWHSFDNNKRSAKNSFGDKIVCYKNQNGLRGWIHPGYSVQYTTLTQFKVLQNGQGTGSCDGL